jgi:hypothetical protein
VNSDTKTPEQWIPLLFSIRLRPRVGPLRSRKTLATAA